MNPYLFGITADQIAHWGPTLAFIGTGSYLFYKTRPRPAETREPPAVATWSADITKTANEAKQEQTDKPKDGGEKVLGLLQESAEAPKAKRLKYKNRKLLQVTPRFLMEFYKDRTPIQGDALVKDYMGKWMEWCGEVDWVADQSVGRVVMYFVTLKRFDESQAGRVYFRFEDKKWKDRLLILTKGDRVCVVGKVADISEYGFTLGNCEIVE